MHRKEKLLLSLAPRDSIPLSQPQPPSPVLGVSAYNDDKDDDDGQHVLRAYINSFNPYIWIYFQFLSISMYITY